MRHPPADLCPGHTEIWVKWERYPAGYNPLRPRDAGSLGPILDSRTSHADRKRGWQELADRQMAGIEEACRSGRSPQCTPKETNGG